MPMKFIAVLAFAVSISGGCLAQSRVAQNERRSVSSKADVLRVDLEAASKGLVEDDVSLNAMVKSLEGDALYNAQNLLDEIQFAQIETDAAASFVLLYADVGCDQDRKLVRVVLQDRLKTYSKLLDSSISSVSRNLASTKVLAVSQVGLRAQDKMRSARSDMQSMLDLIQ